MLAASRPRLSSSCAQTTTAVYYDGIRSGRFATVAEEARSRDAPMVKAVLNEPFARGVAPPRNGLPTRGEDTVGSARVNLRPRPLTTAKRGRVQP